MSLTKPLYIQALEGLRRREGLFRIFIFSLVTVMFWIGFSIFFSQKKTKVAVDTLKFTQPLNPNINRDALQDAALRTRYSDAELQTFPVYDRLVTEKEGSQLVIAGTKVVENTELPVSDTSSATESAELEPEGTNTATPSATPLLTPRTASSSATQ